MKTERLKTNFWRKLKENNPFKKKENLSVLKSPVPGGGSGFFILFFWETQADNPAIMTVHYLTKMYDSSKFILFIAII
jgi:hypothetical protein